MADERRHSNRSASDRIVPRNSLSFNAQEVRESLDRVDHLAVNQLIILRRFGVSLPHIPKGPELLVSALVLAVEATRSAPNPRL